jgi:hypothetical protein
MGDVGRFAREAELLAALLATLAAACEAVAYAGGLSCLASWPLHAPSTIAEPDPPSATATTPMMLHSFSNVRAGLSLAFASGDCRAASSRRQRRGPSHSLVGIDLRACPACSATAVVRARAPRRQISRATEGAVIGSLAHHRPRATRERAPLRPRSRKPAFDRLAVTCTNAPRRKILGVIADSTHRSRVVRDRRTSRGRQLPIGRC